MDEIFINKFKHTKESYIEMNKAYSILYSSVFSVVFFMVYLALACYIYFGLYNVFCAVLVAFLGLIFAFYPMIRVRYTAKIREKQFMELYSEIPEGKTAFFDEYMLSISLTNNAEVKIDYGKIVKIKQSKNYYLLILNKKLVVYVDKNNFEKGTCEDFEKFIVNKSINAKIKL